MGKVKIEVAYDSVSGKLLEVWENGRMVVGREQGKHLMSVPEAMAMLNAPGLRMDIERSELANGEESMKQKRKAFCMIRIAEKKQKNASHKRLRVSAPYYPGKREMLGLALEILGKSCLYGIPSGILGGLIGYVLAALCKQ